MRICAVQPRMGATVRESTDIAARWVRDAVNLEPDLIVFPEMMLTGFDSHLHDLFGRGGWYADVEEAFRSISDVVTEVGATVLIGAPYRTGKGVFNALILFNGTDEPKVAGARSFISGGEKTVWGFVEAVDRFPIEIDEIRVGSVFCSEASFIDRIQGLGLERSEIIVWPCATIVNDGSETGARAIARTFGVPVVQSTYASQITTLPEGVTRCGSVACNAGGQIVGQIQPGCESMMIFKVRRSESGELQLHKG